MNAFSTENYNHFSQIWKPQEERDQTLFLVRLPIEIQELSWRDYQRLMMLRIQWMIHRWLKESGENQIQTHRRLSQALRALSMQEPPTLYEDAQARELEPLWWWMQEWAETFVQRNEVLATKFQIHNGLTFPTQIALASPEIQQAWMQEHDEITLENWLSQLTYGMSE
ncbi:MAG: hypothetical protein J0L70_27110 [Leptolyngbya sp. UWPOB_LEPTO1]|uniref:hypothetical protein n=1 Tax=Leptolyngbya sp. UWPOB_LEPTO1 TaxID=2815653 RepID=UPI001AC7E5BE|nr:hypothetical protein [Leptolyngbya sp. UWPOB_LEPTO1]MBN8564207.1 hypothetical protein [Leptolyngbya sp. UWPOB_LEPTO1]